MEAAARAASDRFLLVNSLMEDDCLGGCFWAAALLLLEESTDWDDDVDVVLLDNCA